MNNFLIGVSHDLLSDRYVACYSNGIDIVLAASTYEDAVLEADMIEAYEYCG